MHGCADDCVDGGGEWCGCGCCMASMVCGSACMKLLVACIVCFTSYSIHHDIACAMYSLAGIVCGCLYTRAIAHVVSLAYRVRLFVLVRHKKGSTPVRVTHRRGSVAGTWLDLA